MRFRWTLVAAIFGALAVGIGAFGAHALRGILSPDMVKVFETASKYHFYHTFLLLYIAHLLNNESIEENKLKLLQISAWCVSFGILIFSGSLYLLAITEIRILGAITPIGGLSFIVAWILLAFSYRK
jgi:uncharacterized membrane protein YgdD (TMEM256/DUF423 family)